MNIYPELFWADGWHCIENRTRMTMNRAELLGVLRERLLVPDKIITADRVKTHAENDTFSG